MLNRDYVNKQFQCPKCNKSEVVYVDLNEISKEGQSTGVIQRCYKHNNHMLIMDIDLNGDIRSVSTVGEELKIAVENPITYQILSKVGPGMKISIITKDIIYLQLIKSLIPSKSKIGTYQYLKINGLHIFKNEEFSISVMLNLPTNDSIDIDFLKENNLKSNILEPNLIFTDIDEKEVSKILADKLGYNLIKTAESIITKNEEVKTLILTEFPKKNVKILKS
jgi:hypothetical protein